MRDLKLIWDFKGPAATGTANHHLVHLKEYLELHQIPFIATGVASISTNHTMAYVAINEQYMPKLRDELKPHRGQLWTSQNH